MTPGTHGLSGFIVGLCTCEIAPQLTTRIGEGWFLVLSILAGQIPDLDLVYKLFRKKGEINLSDNRLFLHRGIGHSIWAHLLYHIYLSIPNSRLLEFRNLPTSLFVYLYPISVHLLEDMLDGSSGIYYFAFLYNKPIKLFSILNDVDDAISHWWVVDSHLRSEFADRIIKRVKAEVTINIPSILFVFYRGLGLF